MSGLEELWRLLRDGGGLMAELIDPDGQPGELEPGPAALTAAAARARGRREEYELLVEAIYEGYLLHYGTPRVVRVRDADLRLLAATASTPSAWRGWSRWATRRPWPSWPTRSRSPRWRRGPATPSWPRPSGRPVPGPWAGDRAPHTGSPRSCVWPAPRRARGDAHKRRGPSPASP